MSLVVFAFPLAILALMAVAIYEHVTSVKLSLPLSPALTFLTILLPLFAAGTTFTLPYLTTRTRTSSSSSSVSTSPSKPPSSSLFLLRLLTNPRFVRTLQVLQGILTTVLATLYFEDTAAAPAAAGARAECELATRWQHLFRAKDAPAVRAVQDAFECCGFRSVRDMAWPFPPADAGACAARFDRQLACRGPWAAALRRSAGVNFGVVLAVGLLQVVSIIMAMRSTGRTSEGFSWGDAFRRVVRRRGGGRGSSYASRPLLTSGETQTEEVDEEVGQGGSRGNDRRRYGATRNNSDQGPRLEPSELQQEQNEWRD